MLLDYIFVGFFVIALLVGVVRGFLIGDAALFDVIMQALFEAAQSGFTIALALTGVLCFWMGLMRVAEKSGALQQVSRAISPFLRALFPSIPSGDEAFGNIFMSISANLLGLDNAATPLGLKTMKRLQQLNPHEERASDAMIMFLAINASGLTLIPTSIIAFRLQAGAHNPADVFFPILLATLASTMVAIIMVGLKQRIDLWQAPLRRFYFSALLFIVAILGLRYLLPAEQFSHYTTLFASFLLLTTIVLILWLGLKRRVAVFASFVEGAQEGFTTVVKIIPYLVAMLAAVGFFRASGAMDLLMEAFRAISTELGTNADWVEALPTMLMKPLSGSGSRALMIDAMQSNGADSFVGRLACTVQGATDTTLYIVALYYGAVRIKQTRYTLGYALVADLAGMITAVAVTYLFFAP